MSFFSLSSFVGEVFSPFKKDRAEKLSVHLNSQDENIRCTYEKEEDHRLPFLDVQKEEEEEVDDNCFS